MLNSTIIVFLLSSRLIVSSSVSVRHFFRRIAEPRSAPMESDFVVVSASVVTSSLLGKNRRCGFLATIRLNLMVALDSW